MTERNREKLEIRKVKALEGIVRELKKMNDIFSEPKKEIEEDEITVDPLEVMGLH